jgi:hypothetical protein
MADDSIMTLKSASGGVPVEFSYRGKKTYYVTLHTFQTKPVFADRGLIPPVLNALRDAALATHFDVILYTFLTDRVVVLIYGRTEESDMKGFLAAFRASAAAAVEAGLGHRLWKRTYLERMLRRGERPEHSVREIAGLPVRAGLATRPGGYEFTGSFVTDVTKLIEPRRQAQHARPEGRRNAGPDRSEGRRPPAGRRPPGARRPPDGRMSGRGGRTPESFRPPGAPNGPQGRRPPEGRRPGFKPGPKRTGGRPPTSPRGKPRR